MAPQQRQSFSRACTTHQRKQKRGVTAAFCIESI
jgi:hypothetical protein